MFQDMPCLLSGCTCNGCSGDHDQSGGVASPCTSPCTGEALQLVSTVVDMECCYLTADVFRNILAAGSPTVPGNGQVRWLSVGQKIGLACGS